ncbi:hypothetical protein CPTD_00880 [Corynebacterium pseudotuberculosis]|nr:Vitamin K-dependent gamma-carboxylase [Corynebacterium pseudotuberculosis]AUY59534.1 Hypothetical protein BFG00_0146 [Corynebacterium pseudotuberculosis]KEX89142.1 hypothetical protein CPTD_00880 [Corynebacterium pseudotuberculosis]
MAVAIALVDIASTDCVVASAAVKAYAVPSGGCFCLPMDTGTVVV